MDVEIGGSSAAKLEQIPVTAGQRLVERPRGLRCSRRGLGRVVKGGMQKRLIRLPAR